ncbi:hypothetical protein CDD83_8423 [Cordyceps sp. RAO-2017]|nr:hypothetical protein CDD83_8423 [Cordyceps sp. RAO-2017]
MQKGDRLVGSRRLFEPFVDRIVSHCMAWGMLQFLGSLGVGSRNPTPKRAQSSSTSSALSSQGWDEGRARSKKIPKTEDPLLEASRARGRSKAGRLRRAARCDEANANPIRNPDPSGARCCPPPPCPDPHPSASRADMRPQRRARSSSISTLAVRAPAQTSRESSIVRNGTCDTRRTQSTLSPPPPPPLLLLLHRHHHHLPVEEGADNVQTACTHGGKAGAAPVEPIDPAGSTRLAAAALWLHTYTATRLALGFPIRLGWRALLASASDLFLPTSRP